MKSNILFFVGLISSFLPFIGLVFTNKKTNLQKEIRYKQYLMPVIALIYCIIILIFQKQITGLFVNLFLMLANLLEKINLASLAGIMRNLANSNSMYLMLVLFNTLTLLLYTIAKRTVIIVLGRLNVNKDGFTGNVVELFYAYDDMDNQWYIRKHLGQARTYMKAAYYGSSFVAVLALIISCYLCRSNLISSPFYPVFAVIIIGEIAFFVDGLEKSEKKSDFAIQSDRSQHIAMYPMLRKPLKTLFEDKLAAEGTTVNNGGTSGGTVEEILTSIERNGGHIGINYAAFIRKKMEKGLKANIDYVRCGYELAIGKSLLFNTPFYDKLNPYIFYAMNRELLTGGKILIVLGRHGTEDDLYQWTSDGIKGVSNIPDLWKIKILGNEKITEENLPDIGIISHSGVHDLDIHKNNLLFLNKVSFVFIVEPSKLVTTAQIGLNLLVKCCGKEREITFGSVDRNCDGLVDSLSHILMTNLTEVSATEYPHGMSSYMYWTADDDYVQHRILPGVSRALGMGTELSMVALKNQVKKTIWYGGEAFPVVDAHWIAKQYYYDLLNYAQLPANQETFDSSFKTSFNMCNERVSDYSFITVEDDRNNLFETRRNFATIAQKQGFVNVISSEYMLREYMATNTEIFMTDPKAIPYITADYARTKRNAILSLCLLMAIDAVKEEVLLRQLVMLNIHTKDPIAEIWNEICTIFGTDCPKDKWGVPILTVKNNEGKDIRFEKNDTIIFKRVYCIETGQFESVYTIENDDFSHIILDDLQNASYIAEQENKDFYIGTELKGHVYQKYLPGQFFTLNGKYYEMLSTTSDNSILVRRASEHIGSRLAYRQVRNYTIHSIEDSSAMGALRSVNNIDIHYQLADFCVDTPGYWKMHAYNDFDNGDLIKVNGVPTRQYHHKQILKFDFSKFGDLFTDSVRMTLTNLLNETFVTLFADNQPFISAITYGNYDAPLTYSLEIDESIENADKCIFIVEESQLDIGLLIAVERNINRIFQIISDYLAWNEEQIEESLREPETKEEPKKMKTLDECVVETKPKKKGLFERIVDWFRNLFKSKKGKTEQIPQEQNSDSESKLSDESEDELDSNSENCGESEVEQDGDSENFGESETEQNAEVENCDESENEQDAEVENCDELENKQNGDSESTDTAVTEIEDELQEETSELDNHESNTSVDENEEVDLDE